MKNTTKIIFISVLILMLSSPIVYLLILFIDKVLLEKFSLIVVEGSKDAWICFAGSIFGGLITMLTFYFTIMQNKKEYEKNKIKSIRPFIILTPCFNNDFNKAIDEKQDFCHYVIDTTVENISNNLVKDLAIEKETAYIYDVNLKEFRPIDFHTDIYNIYTVMVSQFEMIKPYCILKYHTNFTINKNSVARKESAATFKFVAQYKYRDMMDYVEYHHHFEYKMCINYTRSGKFTLFAYDIQNRIESENKIKN